MTAPDADQEAPFDPQARFIARDGIAYKDFAAYLVGRPDAEDFANKVIARSRQNGRSEAFCREYRKGFDKGLEETSAEGCNEVGDEGYWALQKALDRAWDQAGHLHP